MIGRNTRLISPGALDRVMAIKLIFPNNGIIAEVGSMEQARQLLQLSDSPQAQEANPTKEGNEEDNPTYYFKHLPAPLYDRKTSARNPLPYDAPYMRDRPGDTPHAHWCLININRVPTGQVEEYILSHNRQVCPKYVFSVPVILRVVYELKEEAKKHGAIWLGGFGEWILPPLKSLLDMPKKFRPTDMTPYLPFQIHFSMGRTLNPDFSFRRCGVISLTDSEEESGSAARPEQAPEGPLDDEAIDAAAEEAVEEAKEEDDEPIDAAAEEAVEEAKEEDDEPIDAADKKDIQAGAAAAAAASDADDDATSAEIEYPFPPDEDLMAVSRSLFGPCDDRELDEQSKNMLRNSVDNTSQAAKNNATARTLLTHSCNSGRCSKNQEGGRCKNPFQWPQAVNNGSPPTSEAPAAAGGRNGSTTAASQHGKATAGMTPFAAAVNNGEAVEETSNSSVVSPRIQARGHTTNGSTSVQPLKTPEEERPPPNIFFPSLDRARCPELLPRQSQSTPKTKRSKLQHDSSSEDDDSDSLNSYQADSFLAMSNESSSSGSFKTDDCEESESECFEESEEGSGQFSDDYKEEDYDSSDEDDHDDEEQYVPPKRSSSKRKITPTKPFEYAKRKKVSSKKQKTIKDCAPYACTTEKRAIAFLPTAAEATNSANNNHDSDGTGSSA